MGVAKSQNKIQNQKYNGNYIISNYSPSSQTTTRTPIWRELCRLRTVALDDEYSLENGIIPTSNNSNEYEFFISNKKNVNYWLCGNAF